jgi:hypothetical protein
MAALRTFNIPIALLNRVSVKGIVIANITTASKTNPAMPNSIFHATTKPNTCLVPINIFVKNFLTVVNFTIPVMLMPNGARSF